MYQCEPASYHYRQFPTDGNFAHSGMPYHVPWHQPVPFSQNGLWNQPRFSDGSIMSFQSHHVQNNPLVYTDLYQAGLPPMQLRGEGPFLTMCYFPHSDFVVPAPPVSKYTKKKRRSFVLPIVDPKTGRNILDDIFVQTDITHLSSANVTSSKQESPRKEIQAGVISKSRQEN